MKTKFKNKDGKPFAPDLFAVYTRKNGSTFKKVQDDISEYDLQINNAVKVDLYENGTENLSPQLIDTLYNS